MPHTIVLSDKAWSFVESRCGETQPDRYVSMLLENIAGLSGEDIATEDGSRIIDEIEAYVPLRHSDSPEPGKMTPDERKEFLMHTIDYLRDVYQDRIPRRVFEKKCREHGLNALDILEAEDEYARWLV